MDAIGSPTGQIDDVVRFSKRALLLRWEARALLLLITVVLVAGAIVFQRAPTIAVSDATSLRSTPLITIDPSKERLTDQVLDKINEIDERLARIENSDGTEDDLGALFLQTNITRFGTLTILALIVSILVSQYKYDLRLAAFYDAKADVIRLSGKTTTTKELAVLSEIFTPGFDFGRLPATASDKMIESVKSVTNVGQK